MIKNRFFTSQYVCNFGNKKRPMEGHCLDKFFLKLAIGTARLTGL